MTKGQKKLLLEFIEKANIQTIYIGALVKSPRKKLKTPVEKRVQKIKDWVASSQLKINVEVFPLDYRHLASTARNIGSQHSQGVTALFGKDVFAANYRKLKSIPFVDFAVNETIDFKNVDMERVQVLGTGKCRRRFETMHVIPAILQPRDKLI